MSEKYEPLSRGHFVMAQIRINTLIGERAEEIVRDMLDDFNDLRRRLLLPPLIFLHGRRHLIAPAGLVCPECSGRIVIEIEEYETISRKPTPGGVIVWCEEEETDESLDAHRCWFSDWHPIRVRAERWARRYVRVMS